MKALGVSLAAAWLVLGFAGSGYASTIWTLQSLGFSDGATAVGSFTVDSSLTNVLDWNITVSGSSNPFANHQYKKGNPNEVQLSFDKNNFVAFANFTLSPNRFLDLFWGTPLTNAGGVINLLAGDPSNPPFKATIDCPGCGVMNPGGKLSGAAVPEPASFLLIGTGLAGLIRRRRTNRMTA